MTNTKDNAIQNGCYQYKGDQGKKRIYAYHEGHPKFWYQKWWEQDQKDIGRKIENWVRFCSKYQPCEVYDYVPKLKFIGSRSYRLESIFDHAFRDSKHPLADHGFAFRSAKDGRIYLAGSNYNANNELDELPNEIYLGEYNGWEYTMKSEILPPEYDFHYFDRECHTVVWCGERKKVEKNSEKPHSFDTEIAKY